MACEVGRGAYAAPARWLAEGDSTFAIRWYAVADDTESLPFDSAFCSHVYEADYYPERSGPGEVGRITWARNPHIPHPAGVEYHGAPDWFANGVPVAHANDPLPNCFPPVPDVWCLLCENGQELGLEDGSGCVQQEFVL